MEDGVYLCSWSRSGHGFDVWVKSNPKVRASGATRDKAAEALVDAIQEAGGALRAVLEFDPPLPAPVNVQEFLSPRIVQIWGDEAFEQAGPRRGGSFANAEQRDAHIAWDNAHYQGGCCHRCRTRTPRWCRR